MFDRKYQRCPTAVCEVPDDAVQLDEHSWSFESGSSTPSPSLPEKLVADVNAKTRSYICSIDPEQMFMWIDDIQAEVQPQTATSPVENRRESSHRRSHRQWHIHLVQPQAERIMMALPQAGLAQLVALPQAALPQAGLAGAAKHMMDVKKEEERESQKETSTPRRQNS